MDSEIYLVEKKIILVPYINNAKTLDNKQKFLSTRWNSFFMPLQSCVRLRNFFETVEYQTEKLKFLRRVTNFQ